MRRCIVVGGSGYVGRAVCEALISRGVRVAFTYFQGEAVARVLGEAHPGVVAQRLDVSDLAAIEPAIDAMTKALGGLDALVHCPGLARTDGDPSAVEERIADVRPEGWSALARVNVDSAFFCAKAAAPRIAANRGGNLVFLSSIDGLRAMPGPVPYATSKGAVAAMVRGLGKELGRSNVRVVGVAPGVLEGGASRALSADLRAEYLKHCGLKRFGKAEEVARVVAWMALENTYVTAQTLVLDGAL